ncbi:polyribonucleotide nucleotidyltransferase [Planosporangium flavigriseum]|uniref:Polyribonucleotide nucleotidyltransferase n=1 Tax=Planosporangium flavigriseum TaxID=373681 RepID=A0A8J3PMH8_9ACTN|nr:polyribonucleotide nucleotidyltransferase [Planosporangium flavigriseum]NJC64060.1 polyribonucleotide nucleotidyltransferase [Planosporangium flavigriseum]GIG72941.1 polyribonucleotide nucleotidyltransferase [Planosporangium flavigriseum]
MTEGTILGTQGSRAVIDNGSFGTREITFSTGRFARQAAGSAIAQLGDTVVLSATTASKQPKEQFDFFPLTVDVEERMYAAGRIPGAFFRREGRPSEDAILTCRLIDRPLRPSFVKGLRNEVQVVETVLSLDPSHPYDVVAINAASLSTKLSGLPFSGPIGATRMAHIDGQWVAFPTNEELERATFDMVVAGRVIGEGDNADVAIMMVEAESTDHTFALIQAGAQAPTEEVVASGLEAAKPAIRELCRAQNELAAVAAKPAVEFPVFLDYQDDVFEAVAQELRDEVGEALRIAGKAERENRLDEIKDKAYEVIGPRFEGREREIAPALRSLIKQEVRSRVLRDQVRIDGRGPRDLRVLTAEIGVLPRVHGSAVFERGETQILGVTTLNMLRLEQTLDTLGTAKAKRYMHHYNFPPYSVGETGRVGAPKRREIGHGALAERAIVPVLPSREEFPYAIRQVSEALGSNGSTSMGSVCASSMALLQAGVPLKAQVGGVAMGLISDEVDGKTQYVTLTDILGAEDAYGDMDFKVAGTRNFVTALQLDTKLNGIPSDVLAGALQQAHEARQTILDVMDAAIATPGGMSEYAPRVTTIKIPVDKIGAVIGPKGQMINAIQDETGADITIEDDGTIYVGATNGPAAEAAVERINAIANPTLPKVGDRFLGTVVKTAPFGAFVSLLPGRDGLLHISKVGDGKRVEKVEDFLNVGDKVEVQIADIDQRGKIYLDKVRPEGEEAPAAAEGGERPAGGDRGDRGPRDRGERADRGPSRERGDRPQREGDQAGEGGEGGEPRRRRQRHA